MPFLHRAGGASLAVERASTPLNLRPVHRKPEGMAASLRQVLYEGKNAETDGGLWQATPEDRLAI